VPKKILFMDEIPKGATGKLQRIGLAPEARPGLIPVAAGQVYPHLFERIIDQPAAGRQTGRLPTSRMTKRFGGLSAFSESRRPHETDGLLTPPQPDRPPPRLCLDPATAGRPAAAWEPTKPVEFVVPAGTGGGADQMARFIQGVVAKHKLMKQPIVVVNKSGGAGAEGFLDVKGDKGNPHKIVITLSNLFTTPLATGVPFNWRDLTPVRCWRSTSSCCG
jgi:hypothetical protein